MTDQGKPFEGSGSPFPKPSSTYSGPSPFAKPSPFTAPPAATTPPAATPPPAAAPPPPFTPAAAEAARPQPSGRGRLVLAALALVLLVLAASAAGAVIAHEVWTTSSSPTAVATTPPSASSGTISPGGSSSSGGFSITGPNSSGGFSINGPGGSISVGGGGSGTFGGSGGTGSTSTAAGGPANASAIAAKVDPAVVDIDATYPYQGASGAGTGIVVSSNGEVFTNNHVIDGAAHITATDIGNGRTYSATVVGYDPSHDIAVLQLQGASGLAAATLGDSSKLSVGDRVLGLGNAGGVGGTPSASGGTITGLDESITAGDGLGGKTEQLTGMIRTNAAIQAGDSGGPLVDSQGRVIGMDTAGAESFGGAGAGSSTTQAFAIPIDLVSSTASQIVAGHASTAVHIGPTAFLGVQLSAGTQGFGGFGSGSSSGSGVTIGGVVNGEPAQKAGLAAGDVITSLNGQSVGSADALGNVMLSHHPGDTVKVTWTNASGQSQTASIRLASGPPA